MFGRGSCPDRNGHPAPRAYRVAVGDRPTVTGPVEWAQQVVGSVEQLAVRVGTAVWVPGAWPPSVSGPEIVYMRSPGADRERDSYHLRGLDETERLLVISGYRRRPGARLESRLAAVEGMPFETLSRPDGQPPHVVVRTPVLDDAHIGGCPLACERTRPCPWPHLGAGEEMNGRTGKRLRAS